MNLDVLWKLSYGLYVVATDDGGKPAGCVVNTVFQVTSENPIVAMSLHKDHYTYELLKKTRRFSVSILSEKTNPIVISRLGFLSGRNKDKFNGFSHDDWKGLPIINENCCGYLACDILDMYEAETHVIITARVADTAEGTHDQPMSYQYYYDVIKGKAPKYAPTYRAPSTKFHYVCTVCGYVYPGEFEKTSAAYTCPVCSAPKSQFVRQQTDTLKES